MTTDKESDKWAAEVWYSYMTTGKVPEGYDLAWFESKFFRPFARALPSDPRCHVCYYPFSGIGGKIVKTFLNLEPSKLNPHLCNVCENFAEKHHGGAEVELTMLFADIRGSTRLAESMSPTEFSKLIDRFYRVTTKVLYAKYGMVEKLIGDEVTGFFVPGFAGDYHSRVAIEAGEAILRATGHGDSDGPWLPVGVGIHTGITYVGSVRAEGGVTNITVLGDTPNVGAHIASQAAAGEVLFSEATRAHAELDAGNMESRQLTLKSRVEPMDVWVRTAKPT